MEHDHLSDQDLVLLIDGELESSLAEPFLKHLANCADCRTRKESIELAGASFGALQRASFDGRLPDARPAERQLYARLATAPAHPGRRLLIGAALANVLALATIGGLILLSPKQSPGGLLPNSSLTPGVARYVTRDQVCHLPLREDDRRISAELAKGVFRAYGIQPVPKTYEVDYLITPALGGADDDVRNLWPQPYADGLWTAHEKDALEDYLRTLVCEGRLDLATAQRDIASNWIAAYRKYFRTGNPLPAHALFIRDRPWE